MKNQMYKMVRSISRGNTVNEVIIINSGTLEDIRKKYAELSGGDYVLSIFDKNFLELKDRNFFTVPLSYNTIFIYKL